MRQLWFDLRKSLQQAEETIEGQEASESSTPLDPWLVLDMGNARLWFTPVNAPRPRTVCVRATNTGGPPPPQQPGPPYRHSLTEPGPDGECLLDRLRTAARQGHRWLVVDVSLSPQLHTAAAYATDTVPDTAIWTPAWLATGDLGPYPGQIAHGYQHNGAVIPRFTADTVARIAADADGRAMSDPERAADLLVLRDYGSGLEVLVVRAAAMSTGGLARLGEVAPVGMRRITADADGWYRLIDDRWLWRHAAPLTLAGRPRAKGHVPGSDVFEPDGLGGSRCTVCEATGYDIAYEQMPSMAGYGIDTVIWCRICRSSDSYTQEVGGISHRVVWPPILDSVPTVVGGEVTRR